MRCSLQEVLFTALLIIIMIGAFAIGVKKEITRQHKQCLQYQANGYEVECGHD